MLNDGEKYLGLDIGSETIKAVVMMRRGSGFRMHRRMRVEHGKAPGPALLQLVEELKPLGIAAAAVTGSYAALVNLPAVPVRQALARGARQVIGTPAATVISIGSRGFAVLELRADGLEVWRQNSRCSQGTGNFLRQLVERLALTVEQASALCAEVAEPAELSARCPVILKTDVTHLANQGSAHAQILAGCFDAVCDNALAMLKPGRSPGPVLLTGGVSQSARVHNTVRRRLAQIGLELHSFNGDEALFLEAVGCALAAAEMGQPLPSSWLRTLPPTRLGKISPLREALGRVHRRTASMQEYARDGGPVVLGLDIGSTGAKAVAIQSGQPIWQAYRRTLGDPAGAAQELVRGWLAAHEDASVTAMGVTGSGREIVGDLLAACFGREPVYVLNEIAAHAEGALFYDARVDTIFEIGGQDAKYIRLAQGRVVDCAMNEACSAGTGSFLEEQGRKLGGLADAEELSREALAAEYGVSLGQHCSVFMAEMIDQAVVAGERRPAIAAGLFDAIVQNYLHRVKGTRPVGKVIFCQGMPFASDALAAAVAGRTGGEVVVPPNPGMVGALGIALLARREAASPGAPLALLQFLEARVVARDQFRCQSRTGCGGAGQKCRIERLRAVANGIQRSFTWGGGCALHDKAVRKTRLPMAAPDPFREREALVEEIVNRLGPVGGRPRVAMTDEFMLKGLFPLFARFAAELGFDLEIRRGAGREALQRGGQQANVPYCAPLQLFHGLTGELAATGAEHVLVPRLGSLPRVNGESRAVVCPMAQAAAEILRLDLPEAQARRLVSPAMDMGPGDLDSPALHASFARLAEDLGITDERRIAVALRRAVQEQRQFVVRCQEIGRRALAFCAREQVASVVVLGRDYTIHNRILNANVPAILREQGAIAIPGDCFPVPADAHSFPGIYWGHTQRLLRAAQEVRRTPGVYSVFCSNYSCGPDSFGLHFYSYIMAGKPFAVIETDGHAGDAGTRTRIEAFLHCVRQDSAAGGATLPPPDFYVITRRQETLARVRERGDTFLVPSMGGSSEILAAALRAGGLKARALPQPDARALAAGRRHTSGKECLPMSLTLGGLLQYLGEHPGEGVTFMMPRSCGPCRLGMYRLLDEIVLEKNGAQARIYSPADEEYFEGLAPGVALLAHAGMVAGGLLANALYDVRPGERCAGAANRVFARHWERLIRRLEKPAPFQLTAIGALTQAASGNLFGLPALLAEAAQELAGLRGDRPAPTVMLVGELYVRLDPFANDHLVEKLEQRGLRVRLASLGEWLEYVDELKGQKPQGRGWGGWISHQAQRQVQQRLYAACAGPLGWERRITAAESVAAAGAYVRPDLEGEAVLTLGSPLAEWRAGQIAGVVSVGPLECMPNKIAEAQFFHAAERERLPSLTLSLHGEPLDTAALDNFAFEVRTRLRQSECAGCLNEH